MKNQPIKNQPTQTCTINIQGMHCASCASKIETALKKIKGIKNSSVNFAAEKAIINYTPNTVKQQTLTKTITDLGYKAFIQQEQSNSTSTLRLKIIGMDNPHCLSTIEGGLNNLQRILQKELSITENATIIYNPAKITAEKIKV